MRLLPVLIVCLFILIILGNCSAATLPTTNAVAKLTLITTALKTTTSSKSSGNSLFEDAMKRFSQLEGLVKANSFTTDAKKIRYFATINVYQDATTGIALDVKTGFLYDPATGKVLDLTKGLIYDSITKTVTTGKKGDWKSSSLYNPVTGRMFNPKTGKSVYTKILGSNKGLIKQTTVKPTVKKTTTSTYNSNTMNQNGPFVAVAGPKAVVVVPPVVAISDWEKDPNNPTLERSKKDNNLVRDPTTGETFDKIIGIVTLPDGTKIDLRTDPAMIYINGAWNIIDTTDPIIPPINSIFVGPDGSPTILGTNLFQAANGANFGSSNTANPVETDFDGTSISDSDEEAGVFMREDGTISVPGKGLIFDPNAEPGQEIIECPDKSNMDSCIVRGLKPGDIPDSVFSRVDEDGNLCVLVGEDEICYTPQTEETPIEIVEEPSSSGPSSFAPSSAGSSPYVYPTSPFVYPTSPFTYPYSGGGSSGSYPYSGGGSSGSFGGFGRTP